MSLATVGYMPAQVPQVAEPQTAAPDAFHHLPPMPFQAQQMPTPVKMPEARPKPIVSHVQTLPSRQCAIPLRNVAPDDGIRYTVRETAPQIGQPGAMEYVTAAPTCGEGIGGPVKK
jgi:hypothetical protein